MIETTPGKLRRSKPYSGVGQTVLLGPNLRPGKKLGRPRCCRAITPVSRRPLWASCLLVYDRRRGPCISQDNVLNSSLDETFGYDGVNRLISASCANGNTETWTLDSLGNWLDWTVNGVSQTRSTDPSNEIGSITQGGTVNNQGYDLAGNMTLIADPNSSQGTLYCTYDAWDRLVEVQAGSSSGPVIAQFSYDGTDRRVSQTDFTPSGGPTTTYYFYSGQQVVETRQGAQGSDPSTLAPTNQYVWSLRYIDAPILRDSFSGGEVVPASRIYYLGDANYNVTALVDSSGTVIERYAYQPYGPVTVYDASWQNPGTTSAVGNTVLFGGGSVDPETGLVLFGVRYYSVTLGSFISTDPAQADQNLYRYCEDCPTNAVDPTGQAATDWARVRAGGPMWLGSDNSAGFDFKINWVIPPGAPEGATQAWIVNNVTTVYAYVDPGDPSALHFGLQSEFQLDVKDIHGLEIFPDHYEVLANRIETGEKMVFAAVHAGASDRLR